MSVVWIIIALAQCSPALCYVCPPASADKIHDVFSSSNYAQEGLWYRVVCPVYRPGEGIDGMFWWKDSTSNRIRHYFLGRIYNSTNRHDFDRDHNLVIQGVRPSDSGLYLCKINPKLTIIREGRTSLQVIGKTLPVNPSTASTSITMERGQRHRLQCQCSTQATAVVYWSTGEGATSPTDIVAARFPDGSALQFQHGADYGVDAAASLILNSPNASRDSSRFWCHVFLPDGSLTSCHTDVQFTDTSISNESLKASDTSIYVEEGKQQSLPCTNWTSGRKTCQVHWSRTTREERLLQYNVSSDQSVGDSSYVISADFSLVIMSVRADHVGRYRCTTSSSAGDLEVRVIGDHFPLDGGNATVGQPETFTPNRTDILGCPAAANLTSTTKSVWFWSFGAPDAINTTLIGRRTPSTTSVNLEDGCFNLTAEGSLVLNNCTQETAVIRYWCNVFPEDGLLLRSYVDTVLSATEARPPIASGVSPAVIIIIVGVLILVLIIACVVWKRRQGTCPFCSGLERRDRYEKADTDDLMGFDADSFATKLKVALASLGTIPITPWTSVQLARKVTVDSVYVEPDMSLHVWPVNKEGPVRYKLTSEKELFHDGIEELSSRRVLVLGPCGTGKTTFLRKLIYDWSMSRDNALLGSYKFVFYLLMGKFMKANNVGKAVVHESFKGNEDIVSAASVNRYCADNPDKVAILIDDCNSEDGIECAMDILRRQGLSNCTVVMATRHARLPEDPASRDGLRHVTLSGFSRKNSAVFVEKILSAITGRRIDSSPHMTDSMEPETCDQIKKLQNYVNRDIFPIEISRRPVILVSLCQLSIWTKGRIFKCQPKPGVGDVFVTLVKYLLDLANNREYTEESSLSDENLLLLAKLGREVLKKMVWTLGGPVSLQRADCFDLTDEQLTYLNQVGVISYEQQVDRDIAEDIEDGLQTETRGGSSFPCLCLPRTSKKPDEHLALQDVEAPGEPHESPNPSKIEFVLESLQELCVGAYLAFSTENLQTWLGKYIMESSETESHLPHIVSSWLGRNDEGIRKSLGTEDFINTYANVLATANRNAKVLEIILDLCKKFIRREAERKHLKGWLLHQRLVELCLDLNLEGKCKVPFNEMARGIWKEGEILLLGVSRRRIRRLCSLLNVSQESKATPKSLRLLRIGRNDWTEVQQCIQDVGFDIEGFECHIQATPSSPDTKSTPSDTQWAQSTQGARSTQGAQGFQITQAIQGAQSSQATETTQAPQDTQDIQGTLSTQDTQGTDIRTIEECFEVVEMKYTSETLRQIRERVDSSETDLPRFDPSLSDSSVLLALQSNGLQPLIDVQSGPCHSASASGQSVFARCILDMRNLEELVLIGTILSSKEVCYIANNLDVLRNLKKIDLRLNTQFDEFAFVAVMKSLHACKKLSDLRLSLYRVSKVGFKEAFKAIEEEEGTSLTRLKTLHLLHCSNAEVFLEFLAGILKYIHFVKHFHISSTAALEIRDESVTSFDQAMRKPDIMPNLEELVITNMETVRIRLSTLKLPKKKHGMVQTLSAVSNVAATGASVFVGLVDPLSQFSVVL